MTDFDPDWEYGHALKNGNEFTVFKKREAYWIGEFFSSTSRSWYPAKWWARDGRLHNNGFHSNEEYDLINAPAPKRTLKRWYVTFEGSDGLNYDQAFDNRKDAVGTACYCPDKVFAIYEREIVEGTGLDEQPEPEEPKTVKVDFWVNVYEDGKFLSWWKTREYADEAEDGDLPRLACIHIERDVKVGEGLDG